MELLSKALEDANKKNAATWTKVDKELSLLNIALSTLGSLAAELIQLWCGNKDRHGVSSGQARKGEQTNYVGAFFRKIPLTKQAQPVLGSVLSKPDHDSLHEDWLRQKGSKRTLELLVTHSSPSDIKILERAVRIQKTYPTIRRLADDRSLEARKLGHRSFSGEMRNRLPLDASSADPKLMAKPILVIDPRAPKSTPRQLTATPDGSFYSTTTKHATSKGSDALKKASFTWTERRNWIQICSNSLNNSKSGRPEDGTEGATSNSGRSFRTRGKTLSAKSLLIEGSSELFAAALTEVVQQSSWPQHVIAPTRYLAGQHPSLLDLISTNEKPFVDQETEDELGFSKMRKHCKSEIRQWNIRKQATILDLVRKNRNVLYKCMRHRRRNKPSAFSLRDRNGEPTSDPTVVSEFHREHHAGDSAKSFVVPDEKRPEDITKVDAKMDLGIWLYSDTTFSLHREKSAQKAFAAPRMIRRNFSRITRMDLQILYGTCSRPLLECANQVVY
ncbi:hypothetical protein CLF_106863 [Clonorchis sinensis]|uniref:Uncharacterized protein n=1 Tax=Clonorchis sinensis TaxID=79923 RepID=G7YQ80_CLOSI|nr:hypothetical protein CLF_106863 [Clonorchis sinensis]